MGLQAPHAYGVMDVREITVEGEQVLAQFRLPPAFVMCHTCVIVHVCRCGWCSCGTPGVTRPATHACIAHMHTNTHIHMHARAHGCMHVYMHRCHAWMHAHTHACTNTGTGGVEG